MRVEVLLGASGLSCLILISKLGRRLRTFLYCELAQNFLDLNLCMLNCSILHLFSMPPPRAHVKAQCFPRTPARPYPLTKTHPLYSCPFRPSHSYNSTTALSPYPHHPNPFLSLLPNSQTLPLIAIHPDPEFLSEEAFNLRSNGAFHNWVGFLGFGSQWAPD
jgi:hypothetical protein